MADTQLPDILLKKGLQEVHEAAAYIGSKGDPAVMASIKEPPSALMLLLLSFALLAIVYVLCEFSNYYEIKRNWAQYRCMPSVAPFASFYGYNLAETMNFCVAENVRQHAPGVIDPLYQGINAISGVVDGVFSKVFEIESGIGSLLQGFKDFMINFVNSFRLLGTRIRMSFIRVKDIFSRVYGTFLAFVYAGISALTFGENLVCNPLVAFIGTITGNDDFCCFAPDTLVKMADGSSKNIADIGIGEALHSFDPSRESQENRVVATYLFDGRTTAMVRLYGIHVSANHYIRYRGAALRAAGDHPDAVAAESLGLIWCLSTTTNRIPLLSSTSNDTIEAADYEESSDPAVIAEAQTIAEMALNRGLSIGSGPTVPDYGLGLDPTLQVFMKHSLWRPLSEIRIGDILQTGATVTGLVEEICNLQCKTPAGSYVSAAQLIYYENSWKRAYHIWPTLDRPETQILLHITTDADHPITVRTEWEILNVRDYTEVNSLDMQTPYDAALTQ